MLYDLANLNFDNYIDDTGNDNTNDTKYRHELPNYENNALFVLVIVNFPEFPFNSTIINSN